MTHPSVDAILAAGQRAILWCSALGLIVPTLFVFGWMLSLSLKSEVDNLAYPPQLLPSSIHLENYAAVFSENPFPKYALNSLIIAAGSTFLALVIGTPAAYGIARWRLHGMAATILVTRMIPALSFLIPWYLLFQRLHIINTYSALILTHLVVGLPLVVWILISFFEGVPRELEDAAEIDGCDRFGAFIHVALPLVSPGLAVATIVALIASWNNFVFAVILAGPDTRTLPAAIFNLMSFEQTNWGPLAAAALVVTLPVLIMTAVLQRQIVAGLTLGGLRG
jgi:multiple sugar transport system permease protein